MTLTQRFALALRVTLSYVYGLISSLLALSNPSPDVPSSDLLLFFAVYVAAGFTMSWPLCVAAVVLAFFFARSIAAKPGTWSMAAVLILACVSYLTLPFGGQVRSLATVGALAAVLAGICFYCLIASRPVKQISN
jgi:hypothetical protein